MGMLNCDCYLNLCLAYVRCFNEIITCFRTHKATNQQPIVISIHLNIVLTTKLYAVQSQDPIRMGKRSQNLQVTLHSDRPTTHLAAQ